MPGEVVNLRQVRKRRARLDAETQAAANRVAYGIGKADRALATARRHQGDTLLDAHRRDVADPTGS